MTKSNVLTSIFGERPLRRWVTGFVVCTLIALFLSSQWFLNPSTDAESAHGLMVVGHYLLVCYVWGLLAIGIVPLATRIGLDRKNWLQSILTYVLIGIGFSILHMLITHCVFWLIGLVRGQTFMPHGMSLLSILRALQSNLILFTMITSVCLALSYYRKFRERELRTSKLEAQLTQAQLDALKSQLQPHFLFNTLNAISALVRDNPAAAERMIVLLSDLLRTTLDNIGTETVALREELDFARHYLEIEKMRFGDRLVLDEEIDPLATGALVPTLLLQPIVENSVRHGVAAKSDRCQIAIRADKVGNRLALEIRDTGPGLQHDSTTAGNGLGMANTVDRLQHLYGDDYSFEAGNGGQGGFGVRIEIPYHDSVTQLASSGD